MQILKYNMLNKLLTIISKTYAKRRRYKCRKVSALTIVLLSLLIFWAITECIRTFSNGQLRIMAEHTDYYTETKTWDDVEKRNERRRNHLRKMCKLLGLNKVGNDSLHEPNPWEFLINRKHHLVWCNVFKAASSSWMYNFNVLAGTNPGFFLNNSIYQLNRTDYYDATYNGQSGQAVKVRIKEHQ
ncbi:uncharacterized protein LOC108735425 isoform X1 [Agrilus planipennis]|uniref:Uncharacterized protein LOC108735425 isoform X1 n=1 Tax=Agrilus planipennis TaxID=224129 RepID=A0A7F5R474_AGRPL|nr:uncharacterized protein LOC108735425 isoform X1 [Agrilus planipennis]